MTSMTRQYSAAASQARGAAEKTADFWMQGARRLNDLLPKLPQVDLVPAVERYFDFVQRAVDLNRTLAVRWAETAGTLSGVVREQAESAGHVVRERAESARDIVREQAAAAERAAHEQAATAERAAHDQAAAAERAAHDRAAAAERAAHEQAEQAEERAREARRLERERAKKAHEKARERYEGLTKAELSDLLAERGLPKSGNVDELVERLVEADGK